MSLWALQGCGVTWPVLDPGTEDPIVTWGGLGGRSRSWDCLGRGVGAPGVCEVWGHPGISSPGCSENIPRVARARPGGHPQLWVCPQVPLGNTAPGFFLVFMVYSKPGASSGV